MSWAVDVLMRRWAHLRSQCVLKPTTVAGVVLSRSDAAWAIHNFYDLRWTQGFLGDDRLQVKQPLGHMLTSAGLDQLAVYWEST